ncbi:hypothetical protein [Plantactinospora sp. KLBMP9567]|uniref:hypothetical protein n=1 Tax=Plantactinospora sp. KLBMP9567 TaxID=3085900 RepID=UPI002982493D|nr:hypothetical protein [Plantactinospora sp. KLBMP9567]MDW5325359.1 hypothetical protein [Plantactinospora sp. KLBMP9567]
MAVDGGRVAARGFQYQYLRTLEMMLTLVDDPAVASVRVEGPSSQDGAVDAVDFDVLDVDGTCRLAVQVKSKAPGGTVGAAETVGVLLQLIAGADAARYQVLTNGTPTPGAAQVAAKLLADGSPEQLRDALVGILTNAPARVAQLRALQPAQVSRLARCRVQFDSRDELEIRDSLREKLRTYRNRTRAGLGQQSAGLLTGYLVAEILRRAADGGDAAYSVEELRVHLLIDSDDLVRVGGVRDWGVSVGSMPSIPDIARPALLDQIVAAFDGPTGNGVRRVALVGLSGIGKSSLAAAYVADRADSYDWIFWIDGETDASLLTSFQHIAALLRPDHAVEAYHAPANQVRHDVHTELGRIPGRWAMIFDNVGDQRRTDPWIPRAGRGDVITTSIDSTARHGAATRVEVTAMAPSEAVQLLQRRLRVSYADQLRYASELRRLTDALGCWPLALELASGYLDTCGVRLDDVDGYIDQLKVRSLADVDALPPDYPRTLAAALSMCLEQLQRRIVRDSGSDDRPYFALGMITYAAFLAARQLPVHLLAAAVVSDPPPEAPLGPFLLDPTEINLGEVVRELRRFSLVSFDEDLLATGGERFADANRTITTNSIVQELIRFDVEHDESTPAALNRLANHVERWLMAAIELNLMPRAAAIVNHAEALASHLRRLEVGGERVPLLYGNLAGAFRARGEPSRAEEFLRAELDLVAQLAEPNELLAVQAKLVLIDIMLDTPGPMSISVSQAVAYLDYVYQYALDISADYPDAAVRLAATVAALLERPEAKAANCPDLTRIEGEFNRLEDRLGPTPYSEVMHAVTQANQLSSSDQPGDAERLCRHALDTELLTGVAELTARRILVEALVRQHKWTPAQHAWDEFRQLFGSTGFYLSIIVQLVHNVGHLCAAPALIARTPQAIALLETMLDWPVLANTLADPAPGWRARLRLLRVVRHLASGDHQTAAAVMTTVPPQELREGTAEETRAWCALWQMTRLALLRAATARYAMVHH